MEVQSSSEPALRSNLGFTLRDSFLSAVNYLRHGHSHPAVLDTERIHIKETVQPLRDPNNNNEKIANLSSALQPRTEVCLKKEKKTQNTIVSVVLVEAKGLPASPDDGSSHGVYVKLRSGNQTWKSKSALNNRQPQWRERFTVSLHHDHLLNISLWDKGKQKNFMGSCVLDLSRREKERTHDIWHELDNGYGSIHVSITMHNRKTQDLQQIGEQSLGDARSKYAFYNMSSALEVVGELQVKVISAKGLNGRPYAYCTLELDNERIQTPKVSSAEPVWNKTYVFNIYDVTSVLELKVSDGALTSLLSDFVGRTSIPLLRIEDGASRWYALKDSNKRKSAKGNCPRIRLEMSLVWNPVVASMKLFRPKQVKYMAKQPRFDVALVYKNVKFIKETFVFLYNINESFKRLFEWEDSEFSKTAIIIWLVFWYYYVGLWMTPLLIAALFPIVYFIDQRKYYDEAVKSMNAEYDKTGVESIGDETITSKVKGLPEMTITITNGIEYMVSVAERLYNLATFKVPFLSFFTLLILFGASLCLYFVPFNYLMMIFGLYKFGRKYLNPNRTPNNDLLDFISRIPDNEMLKDWRELSVPEPQQPSNSEIRFRVHQIGQQSCETSYNRIMECTEVTEDMKL